MPLINVYSFTSPGPRATNQDAILVCDIPDRGLLCCVADGVGGNQGGETASKMAVDIISKTLENDLSVAFADVVRFAHEEILNAAEKDGELAGMATTLTAVIIKDMQLKAINCGDSRTYLLRGNGLMQLSQDHSEVARLLREGRLTAEAAVDYPRKNILESALGAHKPLKLYQTLFELEPDDRIVLISDGVSSVLSKRELRDISKKHQNLDDFGAELAKRTEEMKTKDNYSIIAVEIV